MPATTANKMTVEQARVIAARAVLADRLRGMLWRGNATEEDVSFAAEQVALDYAVPVERIVGGV